MSNITSFIDYDIIDPDTYVFTFGQYKNIDYADVKHDDPDYILWCVDNIDWFELDPDEIDSLIDYSGETDDYDYIDMYDFMD